MTTIAIVNDDARILIGILNKTMKTDKPKIPKTMEGVDANKLIIKRKIFVIIEFLLAYSLKKIAVAKAKGIANNKVAIINKIVVNKAAKIPACP
jgi:hypothetical protein